LFWTAASGFFTLWGLGERFRCPAPEDQRLLEGLQVRLLEPAELAHCHGLLAQHHYLGAVKPVGERLYYVVTDPQGQWLALRRKLSTRTPRSVEAEALVDTGATGLYLRPSVIKALGLEKVDEVILQTTGGARRRSVYEPVRLDLPERHGNFDVVATDEKAPNLVGQIPLEYLDFVVDPKRQKLIPNPEHGGKQMTEEY